MRDEIVSITSDISEAVLDSFLKDGLFKDVPLIGTSISAIKLCVGISDNILFNKIYCFIMNLDFKTDEEIEKFKKDYLSIQNYEKIGQKIILSLSSADDEEKIKWLANALISLVGKKINTEEFLRCSMIINNSFIPYMKEFPRLKDKSEISIKDNILSQNILNHLFSVGLLNQKQDLKSYDETISMDKDFIFELSEYGKLFMNYIF